MNKFKIGDKVRLRDDLKVADEYGEVSFSSSISFSTHSFKQITSYNIYFQSLLLSGVS